MLRFGLIATLILNFSTAYAHDPSVRRLRFQNTGRAIAVDDCREGTCRHLVTLTPELTRLLRKTIAVSDLSQIPLSPEDQAAFASYGRAWKIGATAVGVLAAFFSLHFNPLFAAAVFTNAFAGWSAAILHFGLIGYGAYKFGEWRSNRGLLSIQASRKEQLARAFDQLIAEVHVQIPPGRSRSIDLPEWLAQQLDLNQEIGLLHAR